jgi:hypothetical protein
MIFVLVKEKNNNNGRCFMARGITIHDKKAVSNENINDTVSYSGPERRITDSLEFFGYFSLECIERRKNGYSLLRPLNGAGSAD